MEDEVYLPLFISHSRKSLGKGKLHLLLEECQQLGIVPDRQGRVCQLQDRLLRRAWAGLLDCEVHALSIPLTDLPALLLVDDLDGLGLGQLGLACLGRVLMV